MTKLDLHMHSTYSDDGEFSVAQLVQQCVEAKVDIMAIADHNSVKAVKEEKAECEKQGIVCIAAIEIDCTYAGLNLHVLGYGIDEDDEVVKAIEDKILVQELACSKQKLDLTNALGFQLVEADLQALSRNGVWSGEMFAEALLEKPEYLESELLKPYRVGGSRSDNPFVNFYWDYYAQGKPCYTEIVFPTLQETIEMIHNAGGIAVLAHPGNNLKGKFELFDEMCACGLDGVEVFSSYHDQHAVDYFLQKANEHDILTTCGSDYHGKTKPSIGLLGYPDGLNEEKLVQGLIKKQVLKEKN